MDFAEASSPSPSRAPPAGRTASTAESEAKEHTSLDAANREIAALRRELSCARIATPAKNWSLFKRGSDTHRPIPGGGVVLSGGNFHGEYPAKVRACQLLSAGPVGQALHLATLRSPV